MSSAFRRTVRGMRDLSPDEAERLRFIEQTARELAKLYGYREVITPVVESYDLLAAKTGEEIRERMYVFEDLGGRKVALRPEFTASIARLVATKMQAVPKPLRLFSAGTLYRYDEPQFGRYREFWQANYELFGSSKAEADAEILALTSNVLKKAGLRDYRFEIGHVGILRNVLSQEGIMEEQQNNIMQLLDKKQWEDALELARKVGGSQKCLENLRGLFRIRGEDPNKVVHEIEEVVRGCPEALKSASNLREILGLLEASSTEVDLLLAAGFARGLEYYTGLIFEVYVPEMKVALAGGGRYDRLIELFGGEATPAVGVALGSDRISLALEKQGTLIPSDTGEKVLVIPVDRQLIGDAFKISSLLREEGFVTEVETMGRSVSRALSDADRRGITRAVVVGPKEMEKGMVVLRDMKRRSQEAVDVKKLCEKIKS